MQNVWLKTRDTNAGKTYFVLTGHKRYHGRFQADFTTSVGQFEAFLQLPNQPKGLAIACVLCCLYDRCFNKLRLICPTRLVAGRQIMSPSAVSAADVVTTGWRVSSQSKSPGKNRPWPQRLKGRLSRSVILAFRVKTLVPNQRFELFSIKQIIRAKEPPHVHCAKASTGSTKIIKTSGKETLQSPGSGACCRFAVLYYVWRQMFRFVFFYAIGVYSFSGSSLWILFCCFCGFPCALSVYILSMSVTVTLTNVYMGKEKKRIVLANSSLIFFSELEKKKKWWFMNLWLGYVEALPTSLFCNVSVLWRCFDFWFDFFFFSPPSLVLMFGMVPNCSFKSALSL